MNHTYKLSFFGLVAMSVAGGCSSDGAYTPGGDPPGTSPSTGQGSFEIVVAPLEADSNADFACYNIAVTDSFGDSVWAEDGLCTDTWSLGNEGTFSYVGLCEAAGTGINSVSIELTRLVADDGTELGNWLDTNPPTYTTTFNCEANTDTVVRANFLVITPGTKGFLDLSVSVDEIACNAKVDCNADFLGDDQADCEAGAEGCLPSVGTIVVALACQAAGVDFTQVMLDELTLTCTQTVEGVESEVVVAIDPSVGTGAYAGYPEAFVSGALGNAGISADGTSFLTVAIGISPGYTDCHLSTRMAANDGRDMTENDQFPIIVATDIPFGFDEAGLFSCEANPLDGLTSGLFSTWGSATDLSFTACLNEDGTVSACVSEL